MTPVGLDRAGGDCTGLRGVRQPNWVRTATRNGVFHPNGNIFVDVEGFRAAMFEQAELQGTQMGPNGPPTAKGTA